MVMNIFVKFMNSVRSWMSVYDSIHNVSLDFFSLTLHMHGKY